MSLKDYRIGQEMRNGDAELAQLLDECARLVPPHAELFITTYKYTELREHMFQRIAAILNDACGDELRAETLRFTNPFLVSRGRRPWSNWQEVHDIGLGAAATNRNNAFGVALTKRVVESLLNRNYIPFEDISPADGETSLVNACAQHEDYRYCVLGIGPAYYAPRRQNAAALQGISYAGLMHWIYVDRVGNVSNYGATRAFAGLLANVADRMNPYIARYAPNDWSVKHRLRILAPRVYVAVQAPAAHANPGLLGDAPIPAVRYATGEHCTGAPDEFTIKGDNFRGDKNVALKIFRDGQPAPKHTIVVPYEKISFKRLVGEKKAETRLETVALNPQATGLAPGSYTVKAYVDDEFETECQFVVLACVPVKKPIDWEAVKIVVAALVVAGLLYLFYLTAKRQLLAALARRVVTMLATRIARNSHGLELYEYKVLKEAPALAHKELFAQSYKGVTIEESTSEYTITGTTEDLLPLFKKLDDFPVVYAFPAENDTYTYHPNQHVDLPALLEVLGEGDATGDKRLLASPGFRPVRNLVFGQKLFMGQFFYDPQCNRLLIFQRDRNLVLYDITNPLAATIVWTANTNATGKWDAQTYRQCYLEITRETFRIHDERAGETTEPLAYPVQASTSAFSFDLDLAGPTFRLLSNQTTVMESPESKDQKGSPDLAGLIATNGL